MTSRLRLDGQDHDISQLSKDGLAQLALIRFADERIAELTNVMALLTRAKKSYIDGLEREIIKARSGIDVSTLLSD